MKKKLEELKAKAEKSEKSGIAIDADSVTQPQVIQARVRREKTLRVSGEKSMEASA